jgi:hypothetical protein
MSVFHNNALIGSGGGAAAVAAPGVRSLRFNDDDGAYLDRTPSSASNRKTWTWSAWVKRSTLGIHQYLFSAGSASNYFALSFDNNDKWQVDSYGGGANPFYMHTGDMVFRDTAAWYHLVAVLDTTESTGTDRFKLYVNGSRVTLTVGTNVPPSNADQLVNSTNEHRIGRIVFGGTTNYFDGYLTDIHFVDGLALTPSSFGSTDSNGVWQRGTYSGTYGTNGFHVLDFENEGTIGHDSSGNSNDYSANNLSDTAGAGNDVLLDFPTNGSESDTGAGGEVSGNYATFLTSSPVSRACTFSNGNLDVVIGSGFGGQINDGIRAVSNIGMTSGKFYFEHVITGGSKARSNVGVISDITDVGFGGNHWIGSRSTDYIVWSNNGDAYNGGSATSYGVGWTTGDIIGCAFDADAGNLYIYKNGTVMNSGTPAFTGLTNGPYFFICAEQNSNITVNFGQRAFEYQNPGTNRPAATYKALCTTNLPTPTIADGRDYFQPKLYTGNGGTNTITGLQFSPDWVWMKRRNDSGSHSLHDTVRGAVKRLRSESTDAETDEPTALTSFTSDGFTLGSGGTANGSGDSFVSWNWEAGSSTVSNTNGSITSSVRASQTSGFSIVTYSGNSSSGATVGHGLGAVPDLIIIKARNRGDGWATYNSVSGTGKYLVLESTAAIASSTAIFNGNPTPNHFVLGGDAAVNGSFNYVAYCFASVKDYSQFGSYEGTNSTDGPFVFTGFRPSYLLTKNIDNSGTWNVYDAARNTANTLTRGLQPNNSNLEYDTIDRVDFFSNGFKIKSTGGAVPNLSGDTYIYLCFAENPFQANGGLAR